MIVETLTIDGRFRGPPRSGNGGYVCGRIARHIPGIATVRLSLPPPLDTPLQIDLSDGVARLMAGTSVIGEGRPAELAVIAPAPVSLDAAVAASRGYRGFASHNFPGCFVCGPKRQPRDGLRIFAGPLGGSDQVAAPWTVDDSLGSAPLAGEFIWAALDCPSAFAVWPPGDDKTIVLGQLTARIAGQVQPGDTCVVVGWPVRIDGRKRIAGSAVFSPGGAAIGVAQATWIEVAAGAFPVGD